MIRITRQTDYGIMLLCRLANEAQGAMHNARDLASEFKLPLPMVSKILKLLSKSNLLESHRGSKGGYSLSKRPEQISVLEIISVLEGPVAMTECSHDETGSCIQQSLCPVTQNWQVINQAVRGALSNITLAQMTHPLGRGAAMITEESFIRGTS